MTRAGTAWLAVVAAMPVLVAGCNGGQDDAEADAEALRDSTALFRFERFDMAERTDGGEVSLKSLAGRVVVLDLFGTWCPLCRRAAPVLVSLYERFRGQGLEIVGLAYEQTADTAQAKRAVEAFRSEFAVPYVLALGPQAVWDELREHARVVGVVPTILLVDRQGVVRDVFEGLPAGHEAVVADRIERLLAEPAALAP
jgi:thiol-disulfide isomerase/thioredoxin